MQENARAEPRARNQRAPHEVAVVVQQGYAVRCPLPLFGERTRYSFRVLLLRTLRRAYRARGLGGFHRLVRGGHYGPALIARFPCKQNPAPGGGEGLSLTWTSARGGGNGMSRLSSTLQHRDRSS